MKTLTAFITNISEALKVADRNIVTQRNKEAKTLVANTSPNDLILTVDNAPLFLAWAFKQYGLTYDIDILEPDGPRRDVEKDYKSLIRKYGTNLYFNEETKTFRGKIYGLPNYDQSKLTENLLGKTWANALQFLQEHNILNGKPVKPQPKTSEEAKAIISDYCERKYFRGWYFNSVYDSRFKYSLHGLSRENCKQLMEYCKSQGIKCKMILANSKSFGILSF